MYVVPAIDVVDVHPCCHLLWTVLRVLLYTKGRLFTAAFLFVDQCSLEDVDQIRRCHSLLLQCFLRLMDKYHGDDPLFIARVIAVLVELRSLGERHKQIEEQMAMRWADKVDIPPLIYEMWSSM
jgi:hypothetical protein